ncbi:sulfotransferase [Amaricoccus solimangrovi]|uniref:sulfotransferase n=1 Tax=Amaricoccus solimangrovi TaxID=2589815 RepID=UPI0015E3E95D|nr:sulfotransferase [Amaricoccus solimangrovi]
MSGAGPVFILGLQRGGTNQPLNIFRSHPATLWPQGEFHEPFRPRTLRKEPLRQARKLLRYAPIWLTRGDVLNLDAPLRRERPLRGLAGRALRAGLADSVRANAGKIASYKAVLRERGFYSDDLPPDRMVVKVMNYNVGLVPDLLELYPDARFVGVIRDGRGVCEGQMARRAGVAQATALYDRFGRWLMEYEAAGLPVRTWRFEDLLADPWKVSLEMFGFCGLDPNRTRGVMLQDKHRIMDGDRIVGIEKINRCYTFAEMAGHMRADANATSLARLDPAARAEIEARCGEVLRHFGYLPDASATPAAPVPPEPERVTG